MAQTLAQRIAANVGRLLDDTGQSQTTLAAYLGISQPMISRRLKGRYNFPLNELEAIAAFFGTTVADLIGGRAAGKTGQHPVSSAPIGESDTQTRLDGPGASIERAS